MVSSSYRFQCYFLHADGVEITASPPLSELFVGQRIELSCALAKDPPDQTPITSITWSINSMTRGSTSTMDTPKLTINSIVSDDAGSYTCSITYGARTLTRTYDLTVLQGSS